MAVVEPDAGVDGGDAAEGDGSADAETDAAADGGDTGDGGADAEVDAGHDGGDAGHDGGDAGHDGGSPDAGSYGKCGHGTKLQKGVCVVDETVVGVPAGYGKCGTGTTLTAGACLPADNGGNTGDSGCGCTTVGAGGPSLSDLLGALGLLGAALGLVLGLRRRG